MTSILPVILIVDDQPDAVRLIKLNLEARGYEVVTASNGTEALKVFNEHHIDLVLLDLTLPDMRGFEVCRMLRASSPDVRIIIVSADASGRTRTRILEACADDYLVKPFSVQELLDRVKRI